MEEQTARPYKWLTAHNGRVDGNLAVNGSLQYSFKEKRAMVLLLYEMYSFSCLLCRSVNNKGFCDLVFC
jgi:hypothetical protein